MAVMREPPYSLLAVACFSRHLEALQWAAERLIPHYGPVALVSPDFDFHHTKYYQPTMGSGLIKRLLVFDPMAPADCLPDVKRITIALENECKATGRFAEERPLNLDPGLIQLGKFLLATTKDQGHRIYLRDGIFAEVTLRFEYGAYEPWPWTYADYREDSVRAFLNQGRTLLHEKMSEIRSGRLK